MKLIILLFILGSFITGCSEPQGSIPENSNSLLGYCGQAPSELSSAGFEDSNQLNNFLRFNNVTQVNLVSISFLIQFAFELNRFPSDVRNYLANQNVGFRILQGQGVSEDPTWSGGSTTIDGRSWSTVPGAGINPTRIVVNRLYQGHGSINLVLHEHAHTLDFHGTKLHPSMFSNDSEWQKILNSEGSFMKVLQVHCGDYCTKNPLEAFAEGFAIYFSCAKGRTLLEGDPRVMSYFKNFENGGNFILPNRLN